MSPRLACSILLLTACQATTPISPSSGGGPSEAPAHGTIASARPIAAGQSLPEMEVPCEATFYVGPFTFAADGDTARTTTTVRSPTGVQVCGLQASWVSGADAFDEVAGTGCAETASPVEMQQTHTYSPGNGGSGNNPVYLKFERHEPTGCAALRLGVARR
jgi:hypothetical protein